MVIDGVQLYCMVGVNTTSSCKIINIFLSRNNKLDQRLSITIWSTCIGLDHWVTIIISTYYIVIVFFFYVPTYTDFFFETNNLNLGWLWKRFIKIKVARNPELPLMFDPENRWIRGCDTIYMANTPRKSPRHIDITDQIQCLFFLYEPINKSKELTIFPKYLMFRRFFISGNAYLNLYHLQYGY